MLRRILFVIIVIFSTLEASNKNLPLSKPAVDKQIKVLLASHAIYSDLSEEIVQRMVDNFLNILDPSKLYMIQPEIEKWTHLSPETSKTILNELKNHSYDSFFTIYDQMVNSIQRRNKLEKIVSQHELPQSVDSKELKDLDWAVSVDELTDRLIKVHTLQKNAAQELNEKDFLALANRRRQNREKKLLGKDNEDSKSLIHNIILKSFAASLDPYTTYFTPKEARSLKIALEQRLEGIGAVLKDDIRGLKIERIVESGPADRSKSLILGDLIVSVDSTPIVGMDISDAVELIRGQKGTDVVLTILREIPETQKWEKHNITITRDEVFLEETRLKKEIIPFGDGVIAHIHLLSFYQDPTRSSAKDLQKAIEEELNSSNLKGIVLDLRNNGGGQITQAVEVAGLFLAKGIVVSVKYPNGYVQHMRNLNGKIISHCPLIILTNRVTASAAEIVAGTLQDYDRALIVGDPKTFGKGSFQSCTINMQNNKVNPQGEYKVTRGLYYTVSGKSPQLEGIHPDIEVPGVFSGLDIGEEFSKYPLKKASIDPNFEDTLTDIPAVHKNEFILLYKHNLQKKMHLYENYLPILKENSTKRLLSNTTYQNFLQEMNKEEHNPDKITHLNQDDLQLTEALNIMKDLIFLQEMREAANF